MPAHRATQGSNASNREYISRYFSKPTPTTTIATCVGDNDEQKASKEALLSGSSNTPVIYFPQTPAQRDAYRNKLGKRLTPHQWGVYDFVLTIPKSKVATYKDVASSAGGSPRSVGNALRNNPFSPFVPCHRVIASNLFVGGFFGEWGKDHKTGKRYNEKLEMLLEEGVRFDDKGRLLSTECLLSNS